MTYEQFLIYARESAYTVIAIAVAAFVVALVVDAIRTWWLK